jgi:Peptidase family M28/PDZ domain
MPTDSRWAEKSTDRLWKHTLRRRGTLLVAFLLGLVCHSAACADDGDETAAIDESPITVPELQAHAAFLASDTLQGREAGTAGGQAVAAYLADELRRLKLQPIGSENDYRQPFGTCYQNVLGLLVGSDPVLKDEWIVVGAHFDHVGFGNRTNSHGPFGQIHNGADDNASGVSCLLEIAEALKGGPPLRRSVAFAFWDGEEKGLLGSEHWLKTHPARPQIRFYTNLDMVGRLRDDTVEVFGVRTLPGLRTRLARSNASDLQLKFDWVQRDDSDHYNFYLRNIPYVMLYTGLHNDYHRPSDDIEKLNIEGIKRVATVLMRHTSQLADHPEPLVFRDASRYELSPHIPGTPLPSRLGCTWSPARRRGETITLAKVDPGLIADKAGLKPGDELLTINGQDLKEVEDFITWIQQSPKHLEVDLLRAESGMQDHVAFELDGFALPSGAMAASDPAEPGIAVITFVTRASFADQSGFRSGDRIHEVREGAAPPDRRWEIERHGRLLVLPK